MLVYPILVDNPRDVAILSVGLSITLILILGLYLITKVKDWLKNNGEISDIEVVNDDGSTDKLIFNIYGELNVFEIVRGDSSLVTHSRNSEFDKDIISGEVEIESVDSESVNMDELLDSDGSSLGLSGEELDEDNKKSSALIQYRDALRQLKAESGKGSGITLEEAAKEDVRLLNMTLEELLTYEPDDSE